MATAPPRNLGRLSEIAQVAARHGFGYLFESRRLRRREPEEGTPSQRGAHLSAMLDELGPTFVKFGQLLSTRPDILPQDIIVELRALQDDVTPFSYAEVERVIQAELGLPIERLFLEFDETPVAAASIGQVHRAMLPNGRRVAVKVQRPNAPGQIEADIALLYQAAGSPRTASARSTSSTRAGSSTSSRARSARSSTTAARRATPTVPPATSPATRACAIPRVYWSYTRARVLTLEYIDGMQLADVDRSTRPSSSAAGSPS